MLAIYLSVTSPSFSLHTQTIRGVRGERRCPPSDDQWGEGEHYPNTAVFAQMYLALLTENASRVIEAQQHWYYLHHIGFMQIMNNAASIIYDCSLTCVRK